ncbi:M14 family metallopeptidase [Paenibacillus prosopidis]|uniref:G-D-glutamyl-meso-diaminopimelate peptidase n=1 Tax=Paenibacillus prosopidis TaxID=630520 RepID=A0A368VUW8_9BACL|nr:M14 family metallocarboxypeptidase [Paenibacillus prosopidis]RCW45589.1 g-D-glutamyl-meso-diaminopimelate peptidase [Paenibacillus prosopidis]
MYSVETYGYLDLVEGCRQLTDRYPFLSAYVIGESVMGKPLLALRCGTGPRNIHMNGSFHANEWITSALLMRFVADLSAAFCSGERISGQQVVELCNRVTLWAVPMVNPDGVELAQRGTSPSHPWHRQLIAWNGGSDQFSGWKANIRGVDLNDQFPAFWEEECKRRGLAGPGPRDYPGPYPLSEPEAIAMARFTETIAFDAVLALHTQGREIYWNYRDYEPAEAEQLAWKLGQVSGYKPVKLTGSDAGYKDWFIQQYRRPGFTVEAGYGENPLPMSNFDSIYVELQPLLLEALRL